MKSRLKYLVLLLTAGLAQADGLTQVEDIPNDWQINKKGYAIRQAAETVDFVGINICTQVIMFASPAKNHVDGTAVQVKFIMRVDTESPWDGRFSMDVRDGILRGGLDLDPLLLKEMLAGQNLRVKWSPTIYSRFNLDGLTEILKTVHCDSEFFEPDSPPEQKSDDSKFFS